MNKMAIILASLMIAACASQPKEVPPQASKSIEIAPAAESTAIISKAEIESQKLAAEIKQLQDQSVYFDFDKSGIKQEYHDVILKQAAFIKAHKNDIVTVEGNCDERGSAEYNLALGNRRANAARQSLELSGVPATQIKTVSYGLEKPRLTCHEAKCWKENRRDDFVHTLN